MHGCVDLFWHRSQFLRLQPGVKLRPHCGEGNFRWVMHLGLDVPKGVAITVGGETVHFFEFCLHARMSTEPRMNEPFTKTC